MTEEVGQGTSGRAVEVGEQYAHRVTVVGRPASGIREICGDWCGQLLGLVRRPCVRAVQALDPVGVAPLDDIALDLEGRRELAVQLRQVMRQDREALDLLDP